MAKVELRNIIVDLERKYDELDIEYQDECQLNFMSRRATYLDGQLAILREIIDTLDDANEDVVVDEIVDSMFDDDEDCEDNVDETGYNPYIGGYDIDC